MAKTYVNTAKYMVRISFEIEGVVDKPDIVGAVFGQSEGLLGDELDLKELQKNGKVGRIEITHKNILGKTKGELTVPSGMDMVQTSVLAAAIESVDKVGPYEAKFTIETIEDARSNKREEIKKRASDILKKFMSEQMPDAMELTEGIREEVRSAKIVEYGPENLSAGPDVDSSKEIIVVEGRADVVNLLRNSIKNVIGMDGGKIPQTILDLSEKKGVTIFVDGDRGGELIARRFSQLGRLEFIARAPDGKEVEELTRKEIIQSLEKKVPAENFFRKKVFEKEPSAETFFPKAPFFGSRERPMQGYQHRSYSRESGERQYNRRYPERSGIGRGPRRPEGSRYGSPRYSGGRPRERNDYMHSRQQFEEPIREAPASPEDREKFLPVMEKLKGTLKAKLFDAQMNELSEVNVRDLVTSLDENKNAKFVVFDGIITKRLVEKASENKVECIVGVRKGKIEEGTVKAVTL